MKVWPGCERYRDVTEGRITQHSFSFGHHYDPGNLAFGPMRAFDDHLLAPGAGFDEHRHSDVELVTWVQTGAVIHSDETGATTRLPAGTVQVQSAGAGIRHSERADPAEATRFLQTWLVPDEAAAPPRRSTGRVDRATPLPETATSWQAVAGEGSPLPVRSAGATLWHARVAAGSTLEFPDAHALHLFVADGAVVVAPEGGSERALADGDALRVQADSGRVPRLRLSATATAELLLWSFAPSQ